MKGKTRFSQGFWGLSMLGLFGLVLGISLVSTPAQAQENLAGADIFVSPSTITKGQKATLEWSSINSTDISITNVGTNLPASGTRVVDPTETTTYKITVVSPTGDPATASVTLKVEGSVGGDKPTVNLTAEDTRIDEGDSTELEWTSTNADRCEAREGGSDEDWDGSLPTKGDFDTEDLTRDTTYKIVCENEHGSASDTVTIRVEEDEDPDPVRTCQDRAASNYRVSYPCRYPTPGSRPTVIIYADTTSVAYGGATFVRWSTINANSCFGSGGSAGWTGAKSTGTGSFYTGSLTSGRTYTLTCSNSAGSSSDSVTINVRPRTVVTTTTRTTRTATVTPPPASSLVIINSSIDRNQPILPTLDNTNPRIGDEITYTVTYKNIGNAAITNLVLRLDLPREVDYLFSTPSNPTISGNTLIFSLGTLGANAEGTVTVRVRVREDAAPGALLNFPATLSYTDPSGFPQSVSATVSAEVWRGGAATIIEDNVVVPLGASLFGSGFWPTTLFGWLLLLILVLALILLVRSLMAGGTPFTRRTSTTTIQH